MVVPSDAVADEMLEETVVETSDDEVTVEEFCEEVTDCVSEEMFEEVILEGDSDEVSEGVTVEDGLDETVDSVDDVSLTTGGGGRMMSDESP